MAAADTEGILRADQELIASLLAREPEEGSESLAFALADISDSSAWAVVEDDRLTALAGWRPLPWDSDVLQFSCGRIDFMWARGDYLERRRRLGKLFKRCTTEAQEQDVCLFSLRLDGKDLAAMHAAEDAGFRVIESYLTFARDIDHIPESDKRVRLANPSEAEVVAEIAYRAFRYNRFLADPLIPEERARHSRRDWVRNAFAGRAEAIYVAEESGNVAGFLLLRSVQNPDREQIGLIDLIAVAPEYPGRGLGSALALQALHHYQGTLPVVEVGTQAKNAAAINLYTKLGFRLVRSEFTLHWHANYAKRLEGTNG